MTNFILAAGYDTVYQRNAVVRTVVPWTCRKLYKKYLRWGRSTHGPLAIVDDTLGSGTTRSIDRTSEVTSEAPRDSP